MPCAPCSACARAAPLFPGTRSCFAISYHFAYAYSMIAGNGVLVHGLGGTYPDQLDAAGPEDLLVCVTQNPYGRQTLEAARDCRQAGVPVLALTDARWRRSRPTPRRRCCSMPARRPISIRWWDRWRWSSGCWPSWPPLAARPRNSASTPSSGGWTRPAPISAALRRPRAEAPGKHDRIAPPAAPEAGASSPRFEAYRVPTADSTLALAPSLSVAASIFAWRWRPPAWPDPPRRGRDAASGRRSVWSFLRRGRHDRCAGPPAGRGTARGPGPARAGREQGRGGRQHRRRRSGACGRRRRDAHDGHARSAGGEPVSLSRRATTPKRISPRSTTWPSWPTC